MRYIDIITEHTDISTLTTEISEKLPIVIKKWINNTIKGWTTEAIFKRREKLGYHPYINDKDRWNREYGYSKPLPDNFKSFDQEQFDNENQDWTPTADYIGDNIYNLIPADKNANNPLYGLFYTISKELTQIVQNYVRNKFGETISLQHGNKKISPNNIEVQVWYKARFDHAGHEYGGIYRPHVPTANGNKTILEIIVNRTTWRDLLIDNIINTITGKQTTINNFTQNIMNTFAHEYTHLEQDIKGLKNYTFSYIPNNDKSVKKQTRNSGDAYNTDDLEKNWLYYARPAEINSFASGAAAESINKIIEQYKHTHNKFFDTEFNINSISKTEWNSSIIELTHGAYMYPEEFIKYVNEINDRITEKNPLIKKKFLLKIKNKFLKEYYRQFMTYIRK